MSSPPDLPPPGRGRPRDAGRDVAILDATLRLLVASGYEQMSIEAVAAEAGVSKATIYRRYPNKAALVVGAVEHRAGATPPEVTSDNLRDGLAAMVAWLAGEIAEQEVGLLGALFAGMRGDPDLATGMRRILRRDEAAMAGESFRGALEHDEELSPRAAELFAEIAPAVIVHRIVVAGKPCDDTFLDHLVDDILLPLIRRR
ncbi:TetR/AcrR family transcriptional regulator [Amycolatopsis sp. NPDC049252]|uniref:TetR/AcrR family transcriptional regulator n=1 Tax=Amycolatopsis sp. NPDC049252 TaxID=3363933 RepID=UPI003723352C